MTNRVATIGLKIDPSGAKKGGKSVRDEFALINEASRRTKRLVGAAALALAGLNATEGIASSIPAFATYEQSLKNVSVVAGATDSQLKLLDETAKSLAANTRFNPEQTTQGLYSLASAGQTVNQQLSTLPNVLNLAEAAQSSLGSATELTVSTMAQFDLSADQSQRVVDTFTASIANSSTNVERLLVAMRNSGADANAFNQGFEESVAIVSILTTAFGNGEKAGTGYKTLLASIAKNSGDLGIDIKNAVGEMRPFADILDEIKEKGIPTVDLIEKFGTEAGSSLAVLLKQGSSGIQEMTDKLTSSGQAAKTAAEQLNTMQGDMDQLGSATDLLKIEFGEMTSTAVRPFIQSITDLVRYTRENLPQVIDTFKIFGSTMLGIFGGTLIAGGIKKLAGISTMFIGSSGAIAGYTVRLSAATVATNLFKKVGGGLLGLLGGLPGIALGAAAGIYSWVTSTNAAKGSTEDLITRVDSLLDSMENASTQVYRTELANVQLEIEKVTEKTERSAAWFKEKGLSQEIAAKAASNLSAELETLKTKEEQLTTAISKITEQEKEAENVRKQYNDTIKSGTKLTGDDESEIKKWIVRAKERNENLRASNVLLKDGEKSYAGYIANQIISAGVSEEEANQISDLTQAQIDLIDQRQTIEDQQYRVSEAQRVYNDLMNDQYDQLPEYTRLEYERGDAIESIDLLKQEGIITEKQHANAIEFTSDKYRQMKEEIQGVNSVAKQSKGIFATFFDSLKQGFESVLQGVKKSFSENPLEATAEFSSLLPDIQAAFSENDSTARALNEIAAKIPIPEVQAVAAILDTIDQLFGGRLLGTNYEVDRTGFNAGTDGSGYQFVDESRKKAFFGGTARRTTESALDDEIRRILDGFNESATSAGIASAALLGVEVAGTITGSIRQVFSADGELVSSVISLLGRDWNEGLEELGKRVKAETVLAQIAQTTGDVLTIQQQFNGFEDAEFGDLTPTFIDVEVIMNEVHAIAERWRDDADLLLEGSQFLLIAQNDILNGFELLNGGTLMQVTDLITGLQNAGESLPETYQRVTIGIKSFDTALDLLGLTFDGTREEAVRHAAAIVDNAGGLEQSLQLWNSFYESYFTDQELFTLQLENLTSSIADQVAEIGQDITFDNFKEQFTNALPDLTPDEVNQWLRLGRSLAQANDLAGQLADSGLTETIEQYRNITDEIINANQTLNQQLSSNYQSTNDLIAAYDGSIDSERTIAESLQSRYNMELQFIQQIRTASDSINSLIDNSIDSIRQSQMTDEERYEHLTGRAEQLANGIDGITDPAEMERTIQEIERLRGEAWAILDEGQQSHLAEGFIQFMERLRVESQEQLENIETNVVTDTDNLIVRMESLFVQNQEQEQENTETFEQSINQMGQHINQLGTFVQSLNPLNVNVNVNNPVYDDVSAI